ncbi:MAG TPA: DsrE family protein [Candidatus Limnocylindrales bacterium]|nr:DsrE family protein [Candidatus Limnocylindrales bacterium]
MKALVILNDPPYGTERSYDGLRLALSLAKTSDAEQRVFLMADSVGCARAGQRCPEGYYNIERMIRALTSKGVEIGLCGTCMDARAIDDGDIVPGTHRSSIDELAAWTLWADKVITF